MTDLFPEGMKPTVRTSLATINSALSFLSMTYSRPAPVTVEEVLTLAESSESWAWRDLLDENTDAKGPEKPADPAPPLSPAKGTPERPQSSPAPPRREPQPNSDGQNASEASTKQLNATFAIGRSKGYSASDVKAWVKGKFGTSVSAVTGRAASQLIDDLQAL